MKEKLSSAQKINITSSTHVFNLMQQVLFRKGKAARKSEYFWAIYLDLDNQVLSVELTALGTLNRVYVQAVDIFTPAIHHKCQNLILVHNHPGNSVKPSSADIMLTHRLYAIAKFLNIRLLDHVIITEQKHYSFHDEDLLQKIKREGLYDLALNHAAQLLDAHNAMKRWHIKDKRMLKTTIAEKILQKGKLELQEIREITGLTPRQLGKLQLAHAAPSTTRH